MFSTGDEVFLIHTGAFGIVLAQYDEKTLLIELDGDEIPVYMDHLVPAAQARAEQAVKEEARLKAMREKEAAFKQERAALKVKLQEDAIRRAEEEKVAKQRAAEELAKKAAAAKIPIRASEDLIRSGKQREATQAKPGGAGKQTAESTNKSEIEEGLHLLFVKNAEGPMGLWLSNNSPEALLFDFSPIYGGVRAAAVKGEVAAGDMFALGNFDMDQVNDKPQFHLEGWLKRPSKIYANQFKAVIKLKASTFVRQLAGAQEAAKYTFLDKLPAASGGLKEFGANLAVDRRQGDNRVYSSGSGGKRRSSSDPMRRAGFPEEIDLHIAQLLSNGDKKMLGGQARKPKMQRGEELRLQLQHCRRYLDQAISLGKERVYLIHGLGKGRLRDEIARILQEMPEVVSFNNDYHPRYGFGATEVILVDKNKEK